MFLSTSVGITAAPGIVYDVAHFTEAINRYPVIALFLSVQPLVEFDRTHLGPLLKFV